MQRPDPFGPFLSHEDVRHRQLPNWRGGASVDDFLDAPDRAALTRRFSIGRVRLLVLLAVLVATTWVGRLIHLQLVAGADYRDQAEYNRVRQELLPASRGILFDRHGRRLTANEPNFLVRLTLKELPPEPAARRHLITGLARTIDLEAAVLEERLNHPNRQGSVLVAEGLSKETALRLATSYRETPGVSLTVAASRTYLLGPAASHLIGYLGKPTQPELNQGYAPTDTIGRSGLEAQYETVLKGRNGRREVERDSQNRTLRVIATEASIPGQNLRLTIDAELQTRLAEELDRMVRQLKAPGGAGIALDPRNGEILALVSSPHFDPNALTRGVSPDEFQRWTQDPQLPLFSRAVSGEYPSGSTIKPVIAAAALEERVITPSTVVVSTGGLTIGQWFFPDWKAGGHGPTSVSRAIADSVNTFFYTVGGGTEQFRGLGIDRMTAYARRFGLGRRLGIDLPGEADGFLPSKEWKERVKQERWYIGDTYHFAIGQGDLLVTPLQLATATAAVANGGTVYRPQLVRALTEPAGRVLSEFKPDVLERRAVSPASLTTVRQGMRQAVEGGSAQSLASLPVPVAGKTGTAQFGDGQRTHAWFTSFAPFTDPSLVLTVLVEGGGEGHAAALPVARNVLSWYFTRGSTASP